LDWRGLTISRDADDDALNAKVAAAAGILVYLRQLSVRIIYICGIVVLQFVVVFVFVSVSVSSVFLFGFRFVIAVV